MPNMPNMPNMPKKQYVDSLKQAIRALCFFKTIFFCLSLNAEDNAHEVTYFLGEALEEVKTICYFSKKPVTVQWSYSKSTVKLVGVEHEACIIKHCPALSSTVENHFTYPPANQELTTTFPQQQETDLPPPPYSSVVGIDDEGEEQNWINEHRELEIKGDLQYLSMQHGYFFESIQDKSQVKRNIYGLTIDPFFLRYITGGIPVLRIHPCCKSVNCGDFNWEFKSLGKCCCSTSLVDLACTACLTSKIGCLGVIGVLGAAVAGYFVVQDSLYEKEHLTVAFLVSNMDGTLNLKKINQALASVKQVISDNSLEIASHYFNLEKTVCAKIITVIKLKMPVFPDGCCEGRKWGILESVSNQNKKNRIPVYRPKYTSQQMRGSQKLKNDMEYLGVIIHSKNGF